MMMKNLAIGALLVFLTLTLFLQIKLAFLGDDWHSRLFSWRHGVFEHALY